MLKESLIRNIEMGPRQIFLFDTEDETSADRQRIRNYLTDRYETKGQAELNDFIPSAVEALGLDAFKVLQHLFWLAHDLEIHFRRDRQDLPANEARQMLIESPRVNLQVVLNKPVDEAVFHGVKAFYKKICPDADPDAHNDQFEFARRLARLVHQWQQDLLSCRRSAGIPGFPGQRDIDDGLDFIVSAFQKLDPFSLIHAFYANMEPIGRLAQMVRTLSDFYSEEAQRWKMLIEFSDAANNTILGIDEKPSVDEPYDRLKMILSSPRPYNRVDEAWQLYRSVKPHHDKILAQQLRQFRETALVRVEALIGDMRALLDKHGADADLRNHSLFALRVKIRSINDSKSIDRIKIHLLAAQETFEAFRDEVAGE
ncbi:MAG: hypothetical protein PVI60_04155 [Desulfobacteraceae bacterium]|jgi:hypothetical protein